MKNPWVIIGAAIILLFGGSFWYASQAGERNNEGVEVVSHIKGNEDATVTLVKYSDFSCSACAAFAPVVEEAMSQNEGQIAFEYRHFPFLSPGSVQAAVAAEAAGQQGKFYEFHDLLFENQSTWTRAAAPQALFLGYAEQLELDIDTFRRHLNSSLLRDHVQTDFAEGQSRGITGTPTFFLNGERMEIDTFDDFFSQIALAVNGETATSSPSAGLDIEFGI